MQVDKAFDSWLGGSRLLSVIWTSLEGGRGVRGVNESVLAALIPASEPVLLARASFTPA